MSSQLILEIQKFNGGQYLKTGIQYFAFPQFAHISGGMAGTVEKMSGKLTDVTVFRTADQYSHLFINQQGKILPKVMLKTGRPREGKSFIFTFYEAILSSYSLRTSGSNESMEQIGFNFSEFGERLRSERVFGNSVL